MALVEESIVELDDSTGDPMLCNTDTSSCCSTKFTPLGTSIATMIYSGESAILESIQTRVEETFGMRRSNAGTWQHLFYSADNDDVYKKHTDCAASRGESGKSRAFTVLLYLNDADGGQTVFPDADLAIKPRRGSAAVFRSVDADGSCMEQAAHRAARLHSGNKSVVMMWYMSHPIPRSHRSTDKIPVGVAQSIFRRPLILCDQTGSCREYRRNVWADIVGVLREPNQSIRAPKPCDNSNKTKSCLAWNTCT